MAADPDLDRYRHHWRRVDPAGVVVVDDEAEATVAGCAVARADEAAAAMARLEPTDWYDGRYRALVVAAAGVPALVDGPEAWTGGHLALAVHGCAARATAVVEATGVPLALVVALVRHRTVCADSTGAYARRVAAAAAARRAVRSHLDALDALGVDLTAPMRTDPGPAVVALAEAIARHLAAEVVHGDRSHAELALGHLEALVRHVGGDPDTIAQAWQAGGQERTP